MVSIQQSGRGMEKDSGERGEVKEPETSFPEEESSIRDGIANVANAVQSATSLGSSTCGFSSGVGIAAIPCLAAETINLLASGIGFIFRR